MADVRIDNIFKDIVETIREPLLVLDSDLKVILASHSFYDFFKVEPEETVGQLIYDLGNKQWDIPKLRELLENILPEKTTFDNYEVEHDFATIGRCTMLLNARQIEQGVDKERIILLAIEDITEHKQAEEKQKDAEKGFHDLVENSPIGISIIQDSRIVYQNPKQEKLFGPLPRKISIADIKSIHPDDLKKTETFYNNIRFNKVEIQEINFRFYPMDDCGNKLDMKWVHCQTNRTKYMRNKAILINIMDITRTKELEKLVKIQDKMSSLGRISAGISHEIGNALASMNIYLFNLHKMCDRGSIELEKTREIYENLQSVYGRIKSVVKRVTDFSNPGDLKFILTDINQPINKVIDLVAVTLRDKGFILEKTLTEDMEPCQADPKLIMQVILNIINNAADAVIDAEKNKRIKVISSVENDLIVVRISDSGPGIPPNLREKVFDPFYTTKARGTGIGLSLCHRIITDHGGSINISSSKWGGAAFSIEIPTSGA